MVIHLLQFSQEEIVENVDFIVIFIVIVIVIALVCVLVQDFICIDRLKVIMKRLFD